MHLNVPHTVFLSLCLAFLEWSVLLLSPFFYIYNQHRYELQNKLLQFCYAVASGYCPAEDVHSDTSRWTSSTDEGRGPAGRKIMSGRDFGELECMSPIKRDDKGMTTVQLMPAEDESLDCRCSHF